MIKLKISGVISIPNNDKSDFNPNFIDLFNKVKKSPLQSSIRLIILMSLAVNEKMKFSDLLKLTQCSKGSLSNHISKLEDSGLITTKHVSFFTSPRLIIKITDNGMKVYEEYINTFQNIIGKMDNYNRNEKDDGSTLNDSNRI